MAETRGTVETKEQLTRELLSPPGNENVGQEVFEILKKILEDKSELGLPARWKRNYELVRNRHWRKQTKNVPLLTANLIFTHRQRTVNMLTDNNPTFSISRIGMEVGKEDIYKKLLRAAEYWWIDQEQQGILEESVSSGETNGVTIEKVVFNPDLEYGIGEVETIVVDPHQIGWYPVKCKEIQKAEAVLHFWPMSVREARRKWPDFAEEIRADKEFLEELGDDRREIQAGSTTGPGAYWARIGDTVKMILNKMGLVGTGEEEECLIVEAWVRDYTKKTEKEKRGKKELEVEIDVYPGNIRCVTCCNAGKIVLSDVPNPSINPQLDRKQAINTYLYDKVPFNKAVSVRDPVNAWGFSDIEQLEQLQIEVDKTLSLFTLYKDRASRLKIINPRDSGVSNTAFTNKPGLVNPKNYLVAQGIKYMDPPAAPIDLNNALTTFKDLFFLVAGSFELELAQAPGRDVIAYKAIAALLERATTMLKGKVRNYSAMVRERGRMYLSHVMNWYTENRWIGYEEAGMQTGEMIKGKNLIVPSKLSVVSGSTMPVSKIQERAEAIELFQMRAIDHEALLKRIEWEDWQEVAKRMKAGQIAPFFDMLVDIGVPQPMIALFSEMATMQPKEFETALKKGEIPSFLTLLQSLQQGGGSTGQGPLPPSTSELEAQKISAEIELIKAKTQTEIIEQQIAQAKADAEIRGQEDKAKIERAKAVAGMETGIRKQTERSTGSQT